MKPLTYGWKYKCRCGSRSSWADENEITMNEFASTGIIQSAMMVQM